MKEQLLRFIAVSHICCFPIRIESDLGIFQEAFYWIDHQNTIKLREFDWRFYEMYKFRKLQYSENPLDWADIYKFYQFRYCFERSQRTLFWENMRSCQTLYSASSPIKISIWKNSSRAIPEFHHHTSQVFKTKLLLIYSL